MNKNEKISHVKWLIAMNKSIKDWARVDYLYTVLSNLTSA